MVAAGEGAMSEVRRHFRDPSVEIDVGPGWLELVLECHRAVAAEFPEYELLAVKQKWASLAFQAFPRPWRLGGNWTDAESERLDEVIEVFARRSETVCERCGADGSERASRPVLLVLCDRCESRVREGRRISR
ncbi:hypothetical protein GCM10011583_33580 [Streptomyces camponoticapitis]|uniref:DksA C4-type domain-containing protein n=1 Tax=Streptomyces camponoticapitis TaxID=1616125 RepID=A0ABQ2E8S4_9ACTN|nr:hypothetical protein [Streptomyces camponoticapitis]GGJ99376.1 hypothetical protein GCM10011583_33580 [Streptomyces camponoticapitis]